MNNLTMKAFTLGLITIASATAFAQTIDASQAASIALESYPNDTIIEIDFERENNRPMWDVDMSSGISVYIDATSGNILEVERDSQDDWDDRDDQDDWDDDMTMTGTTTGTTAISAEQAYQIALERYPNTQAFDIDLERERGTLLWDVELSNGLAVYVDANSGSIVDIEQDN